MATSRRQPSTVLAWAVVVVVGLLVVLGGGPGLAHRVADLALVALSGVLIFSWRALRHLGADLTAADAAWRSLVDNVEGCVWRMDADGRFTFLSSSARDVLGWEPDELLGQSFDTVLTPESAAQARAGLASRQRGEFDGPRAYELVHRRADGGEVICEVRSTPILAADGQLVAVQGITRDVSAARRSELAFQRVVEASPMGMHLYELLPDDRLVFRAANPAADRLLGLSHDQFVGKTIEEAFPPLAETEVPVRYRAAARDGTPWYTQQINYQDEQIRGAFEVHAFQTQPGFMAVMFLDIAERLRAEQQVRESEDRFRFLFDEMAQGVVYQNAAGEVVMANRSALRILGLTMDQMLGRSSVDPRWQTVLEDGRPYPGDEHPAMVALRTGQAVRDQMMGVYNPVDGKHRWIMVSAVPRFRPGGSQPRHVFSTFSDVTALREAGQALRDSERLLRESQEAARLGSFVDDLVGGAWTTSASLSDLFGAPAAAVDSRAAWFDLVHADDREVARSYLHAVAGGADRVDLQYRVLRAADGAERWVHMLGEVERDDSGAAVRLRGTVRDITESKLVELEQARLQAQLQRSQRLESVGVLAGGIAHDFNNILGAILGFTEMAQDTLEEDHPGRECLDHVLRGAERAAELVRQILAFSRQVSLSPTAMRLDSVVKETIKMARAVHPANVDIRLEINPRAPAAMVDPTKIHQVLMNLCTNAAHAIGPGGGRLTVALDGQQLDADAARALGVAPADECVVLTVSDTGCGMDAETRERIFDPFFTTKAPGEGTGLGLSTSHGIITGHGGAISVYSEPGQGSTFRVYLPAVAPAAAADAATADAVLPMGQGTVLFVDDERALVGLGQTLLRSLGYEPMVTCDPREALAWLQAEPGRFVALLTDQTMPHMLGTDLARAAHETRPDLPVIVTSGFVGRINAEEAAAAGVNEVLFKPYGRADVARVLDRWRAR